MMDKRTLQLLIIFSWRDPAAGSHPFHHRFEAWQWLHHTHTSRQLSGFWDSQRTSSHLDEVCVIRRFLRELPRRRSSILVVRGPLFWAHGSSLQSPFRFGDFPGASTCPTRTQWKFFTAKASTWRKEAYPTLQPPRSAVFRAPRHFGTRGGYNRVE